MTFDGTSTNFAIAPELETSLKYPDPKPWFVHPVNKERVHITLNPWHMLKLVTLADWGILQDLNGQK